MDHPFHSKRLIYRAVEIPEDDTFFQSIQNDAYGYQNSNTSLAKPQSKKQAADYQKYVAEDTLLGVVFCVRPVDGESGEADKPAPVGSLHFSASKQSHHRNTMLSIDVVPHYQGQGYGTEAIEWALRWAFETAGMHRVSVGVFQYNESAKRLYERLGFVMEGVQREEIWHRGQWWDSYWLGMLDREWKTLAEGKIK